MAEKKAETVAKPKKKVTKSSSKKVVKTKTATKKTGKAQPGKKVKAAPKRKKVIVKPKSEEKPSREIPDKYEPGLIKVNLYSTKGKVVREINLPKAFDATFRPDLIRRDVKVARANRRQRYGPAEMAGMRHAVAQWGKGRGVARVQRLTQGHDAAESPPNVGGRRAHPPKPEHDFALKINQKERKRAKISAIAAMAVEGIVRQRGHRFGKKVTVPVIIEDDFAKISKTKKVIKILEKLKVYDDVLRAENGKHVRSGRGKMRGRRYKTPNSIIIVVPELTGIEVGARNLPGVVIVTPEDLNTELLAPGGDAGRLAIFTESAVKIIGGWESG